MILAPNTLSARDETSSSDGNQSTVKQRNLTEDEQIPRRKDSADADPQGNTYISAPGSRLHQFVHLYVSGLASEDSMILLSD